MKQLTHRDKYFLRDLHQEIDLYDRKLAYLDKFVWFASPRDRGEAKQRLLARRAPLEKMALALAASGVEYEEKDLPRSFRTMNLEHISSAIWNYDGSSSSFSPESIPNSL